MKHQKEKHVIYPCPKCEAVANIDPKATNLTCPQCGHGYKKTETIARLEDGKRIWETNKI